MAHLFDPSIYSVLTAPGAFGVGATLGFYQAGTTTPATVYSDGDLGTPSANPVTADASGRFPAVWLDTGDYKIVLKNAAGVTLVTVDEIGVDAPPPTFDADLNDFLDGSAPLPIANGGTGSSSAANALAAIGALPKAGGDMSANIGRVGKGPHIYFNLAGLANPEVFLGASASPDPRGGLPGQIWLKF